MNNNKFCSVPWVDLNLSPTGHYGVCCAADHADHQSPDRVPAHGPMQQHWNGRLMRATRSRLLQGQLPDICRGCGRDEDAGIRSRRQRMNQRYLGEDSPNMQHAAVRQLLQHTSADGHSTAALRGIDLSYGNTCQLRCIQCSPSYSRSVAKDYAKLGWDFNHKNRMPVAAQDRVPRQDEAIKAALEQIKPHMHTLEYVKFIGGEPTITRPLMDFMRWCIQHGHNRDLTVLLNTNAVSVSDEFLHTLSQFKRVLMGISVDGVGALDEWIRYPTRWSTKHANIKRIMSVLPESYVATTLFSLNIHMLPELITWCRQAGLRQSIVRLNWPEFFSVQHLPAGAKDQLFRSLSEFARSLPPDRPDDRALVDNQYRSFLQGTMDFMLANSQDPAEWQRCRDTIDSYNSIRPRKLQQVNPALAAWL